MKVKKSAQRLIGVLIVGIGLFATYPYIWRVAYLHGIRLVDNRIGDIEFIFSEDWFPSANSQKRLLRIFGYSKVAGDGLVETLLFSKPSPFFLSSKAIVISKMNVDRAEVRRAIDKSPIQKTISFPWGSADVISTEKVGMTCCSIIVKEYGLFISAEKMEDFNDIKSISVRR